MDTITTSGGIHLNTMDTQLSTEQKLANSRVYHRKLRQAPRQSTRAEENVLSAHRTPHMQAEEVARISNNE